MSATDETPVARMETFTFAYSVRRFSWLPRWFPFGTRVAYSSRLSTREDAVRSTQLLSDSGVDVETHDG